MSWLKFDINTPEKPEVLAITMAMGWDDPDLTVGKLFKVWRWFDQHTELGNAASVSPALLDRIIGVSGFSSAMESAGWLVCDEIGVSLPNFDRHNGKTAKTRAQTAKRVASHFTNAKTNAGSVSSSVSDALPRVREEKEINQKQDQKKEQASPSGSRLPKDWQLPDDWRQWAEAERPGVLVDDEAAKFADYWHGVAGAKGRKADWAGTWRNWIRNSRAIGNQRAGPVQAAPGKTMQALQALEDLKNGLVNPRNPNRIPEADLPRLGSSASR